MISKAKEVAILTFLKRFNKVPFTIQMNGHDHQIGDGESQFSVTINNTLSLNKLIQSTSLALGEAYMDGDITIHGDIYKVLKSILMQKDDFSLIDSGYLSTILHSSSSKSTQCQQVRSHYDLGNDFYKMWLDESMAYSCAYFKSPDDTLHQAQINKIDYILKKLYLKPGQHLLDIGCGWGWLILKAAKTYGVKATGITLSQEQYEECQKRIKAEGLEGQVEVRIMDYRDLPKSHLTFDRIVSVGMLEHVGREHYGLFIDCVNKVLKPGGLSLLHFITSKTETLSDPWIRKYIFPGGEIPSLREIISLMADANFDIIDVENLRRHYAKTLLCWNDNFQKHREEVVTMFDERFARMWELYLLSCAAMFSVGRIDVHQILSVKGYSNELPLVRWY